jgi:hypothetical protein
LTVESSNDWKFGSGVPPPPGPKALVGALPNGTVVDERFEVRGHLGSGGMGAVHLAWDLHAGRAVALKLLTRVDASALLHFEREGALLARVDHPNVVRVHAAGRWKGVPYLVLELIPDAEPLDEALFRVSPRTRVEWLAQVADGVAACHAAGLVHRDLKPTNVLVGAPAPGQRIGRPRVTDFGLAIDPTGPRVTEPGTLLGTPAYMPPEVLVGETAVVPQFDTWSLGVMLHEALARAHPFPATSLTQLAFLLSKPPPPVRIEGETPTLSPQVRRGLEALVRRCLARTPAERPADAAAFAVELRRLLAEWPEEVTPSGQELPIGRTGQAALRLAALVAGAVVTLALALALVGRPPAPPAAPPPVRPPSTAPAPETAAATPPAPAFPAWFEEASNRPPRLPPGLVVGEEPWTYVLERDPSTVLCWVPGGVFRWPTALDEDRPVQVAGGVFLGREEVTYGQLARVLGLPLRATTDTSALARGVDWITAQRYCRRLGLRLPTEVEWLSAALGNDDRPYPWGEKKDDAPLGRGERCAFGLRGLGGGVFEWTQDLFNAIGTSKRDQPDPPPRDARRVLRGGAAGRPQELAANSERRGAPAENAFATSTDDVAFRDDTGLRVALDLEPDPSLGPVRWRLRCWEGSVGLDRGPPTQERQTDDLDVARERTRNGPLAVEGSADVELPAGRYLLRLATPARVELRVDGRVLAQGPPEPEDLGVRIVAFQLAARRVVKLAVSCPDLPGDAPLAVDLLLD